MRALISLYRRTVSPPSIIGMPLQKAIACGLVPEYRVGKWTSRWNRFKLWWNPRANVEARVLAHRKDWPENELCQSSSVAGPGAGGALSDSVRELLDINKKCIDNANTNAGKIISSLIRRGVLPKEQPAHPMTYEALFKALNELDAVPPLSPAELEAAKVPPALSEVKRAVDPQLSKVFDDAGFPKHEDKMPPMPGRTDAGSGQSETHQGQESTKA